MYSTIKLFSKKINLTTQQVQTFLKFRSTAFHILIFFWHSILNYYAGKGITTIFETRLDIVNSTYGLGSQYITVWNTLMQQAYFNLCLVEDILAFTPEHKYHALKKTMKKFISYSFASIVSPLAWVVLITFWSIYPFKPTIIDEHDVTATYFPLWVNHAIHTNTVVLVMIEKLFVYRQYPEKLWGFAGWTGIVLSYATLLVIFNFISGLWPYPLFALMSNIQRILFLASECLLGFFFFVLGSVLNRKIWGKKTEVVVNEKVANEIVKKNE